MSSLSDILTAEEFEIFNQFRKSVEDILKPEHDDRFLLRWLRARNFNLHDAEEMLRKHMSWRKITRADEILQVYKFKEVITKYWPMGIIGSDKCECPVWLIRFGEADHKGIVYSTTRNDALLDFTYYMELTLWTMKKNAFEKGVCVEGAFSIIDMNNTSFYSVISIPVIRRAKDLVTWFEANYPEILKSIYLINAPTFIQIPLALLKSVMSEKTFQKIHVYGKDQWKEKLLQQIDETVLPVMYGGKNVGPINDANGFDLMTKGGTVPKSYYIKCKLSNEEDAKIVEVEARANYTVEVEVEKPKSVLCWEFRTKEYNIGFGLFFVADEKLEEIIVTEKQSCHTTPENGNWLCTKPGRYALKFDNSYSWIRSKTLIYRIEVLPPQKD